MSYGDHGTLKLVQEASLKPLLQFVLVSSERIRPVPETAIASGDTCCSRDLPSALLRKPVNFCCREFLLLLSLGRMMLLRPEIVGREPP